MSRSRPIWAAVRAPSGRICPERLRHFVSRSATKQRSVRPMKDLRTEDDLRAAFEELSQGAPEAARVLPSAAPRAEQRRRQLHAWAPAGAAAAVVAIVVGLTVALSPDRGSGPPALGIRAGDLVGIQWQVRSVGGTSAAQTLVMEIEPNGRFFQNIGSCSALEGQMSIALTKLKIEHVRLSLGLCPIIPKETPLQQQQATALKAMLSGTVSWFAEDGRLTLRKDGVPAMVYTPFADSPAHTRQWTFHGVGISLPADWPSNAVRCGTPT